MWAYGKGHLGVLREWVVRGGGLDGYFGEPGCQWASRSVLKDFIEDALTVSAGSLFQKGQPEY